MTYDEAVARKAELEKGVEVASAALKGFPTMPNGLTPDAVKQTPEFQEAKRAYSRAFEALRNFNAAFFRAFPKGRRPKEAGMDRNEMMGWVRKNCKFAAMPIPGTNSTNQLEHVVRDVANKVLQFMNQSKQTGHGQYDVNQFMLKTVNEAAAGMSLNPAQKQELMETVKDAVGAHAGAADPRPQGVPSVPPAGQGTPFKPSMPTM